MDTILHSNALAFENKVLHKPLKEESQILNPIDEKIIDVCVAPSELFGPSIAQGFGYFAEAAITYILRPHIYKQGISELQLYTDYSFAGSEDPNYTLFLKTFNEGLAQSFTTANTKRPDILIHNNVVKEYYEVKPNSRAGKAAGRAKLREIEAFYLANNLPYSRGKIKFLEDYNLGSFVFNHKGMKIPVELKLHFTFESGLILYELCVSTKWKLVVELNIIEILAREIFKYLAELFRSFQEVVDELIEFALDHKEEIAITTLVVILLLTGVGEVAALLATALEYLTPLTPLIIRKIAM